MAQQKVAQKPAAGKYDYDGKAVVEAIARGAKSYTEIAAEHGVTRQCISQIARGRRREDLYLQIMEVQEGYVLQAQRLAVACAVQVMAAHIREGLEGTGETARKCREYVINRVLGEPGKPAPAVPAAKPAEFDMDAIASWHSGRPEEEDEPLAAPGSIEERLLRENRWIYRLKLRSSRLRALQELKAAAMAEDIERELRDKKAAAAAEAGKRAEGLQGGDEDKGEGNDAKGRADRGRATQWDGKENSNDADRGRAREGEENVERKAKETKAKVREVVRAPLSTS